MADIEDCALDDARREVAARYLAWAERECDEEVAAGFPRLRAVRSVSAVVAVETMAKWSPAECAALMKGGLRSQVLGVPLSDRARALMQQIRDASRDSVACQTLYRIGKEREGDPFDLSELRDRIEQVLRSLLGAASTQGDLTLFYTPVRETTLQTVVDFGGGRRKLRYHHDLLAGRGWSQLSQGWMAAQLIRCRISLAEWLGVGESAWQFLTSDDSKSLPELIHDACAHFVAAADRLTNGITTRVLH